MKSNREQIQEIIVQPLIDLRYKQPDGPVSQHLSLYVDALEDFDPNTLRAAYKSVMLEHDYRNWPIPAKFRKACLEMVKGSETPATGPNNAADVELMRRSHKAHEYVSRRMQADGGKLLIRTLQMAIRKEVMDFLFAQACAQLRNFPDTDPTVPNADLEAEIERHRKLGQERAESRGTLFARIEKREARRDRPNQAAAKLPDIKTPSPETADDAPPWVTEEIPDDAEPADEQAA